MIKNKNIDPAAAIEASKLAAGTLTSFTLASPVLSGTATGTYTLGGTPTITAPAISDCAITGTTTIGNGCTLTTPAIAGMAVTGTSTIGNGCTITTPVLSGSVTGTYTLAGTPTVTSPTITGATLTTSTLSTGTLGGDLVDGGIKRCSADTTAASDIVPGDITGLTGFTLTAAGTYAFDIDLQTSMSTNGGIGVCFKYTTMTLTSIQVNPELSAVAGAISVARNTTTTDQTLFVNTKAAVYLGVRLRGTMVVNAGGTLAVQMCQESSHIDTTTVFAGSTARFTRIA